MRKIDWSNAIKRDFKRAKASPRHAQDVEPLLEDVLELLAQDMPLPEKCRDHALIGTWKGYRECHIKPDLLLVYKTEEPGVLRLARLGSHSELFSR